VGRLHHLSEENQHPGHGENLERRQHLRDDPQVFHLHHLNERNQRHVHDRDLERQHRPRVIRLRNLNAEDGQSDRVQRRQNPSAHHRHRGNMAGRQLKRWGRVRLRGRVVVLRTIHRVAAKGLNVKNSALLRQRRGPDPSAAALNSERRRQYVNLAVHRPRAGLLLLAKRAARENEVRGPLDNLAGNRAVERLRQLNTVPVSQSAERKSQRKDHPRQVRDNSGTIFTAAPEQNFGAACF